MDYLPGMVVHIIKPNLESMKIYKLGKQKAFIEDVSDVDKPSDPIIRDAFDRIWEKLRQSVFLWEEFKTDLPLNNSQDHTFIDTTWGASGEQQRHGEDLRAMCFDEKGRRRHLSKGQHEEIAETARFTVKSSINERYDNVWLLGSFLQLGRREARRRLEHSKVRADRYWFLELPKIFSRDAPLSMRRAYTNIRNGLAHLFQIPFGVAEYRPRYTIWLIERLLRRQSRKHLFSELTPSRDDERVWVGSTGTRVNVLLADTEVRSRLTELIDTLKGQLEKSGDLLDASLLNSLTTHPDVTAIHEDLPVLLRRLHDFHYRLSPAYPRYQEILDEELAKREQRLIENYPHRGRYQEWRQQQLEMNRDELNAGIVATLADELEASLGDGQEKYLLHRLRQFEKVQSPAIRERLMSKFRISLTFRPKRLVWSMKPPESVIRLDTTHTHFGTDTIFWRLRYLSIFTWQLFFNSCLRLMRTFLYHPIGMRYVATLRGHWFTGETWIDSGGALSGKKEYSTHVSDLSTHIDLIATRRREFENKSDYGLFPRSVGRFFNRIYCYLIIGAIGIPLSMALRYMAFVVFNLAVILALVLTPLWVSLVAVIAYLGSIFVYDWFGPESYYDGYKRKPYTRFAPLPVILFYHIAFRGIGVWAASLLAIVFYALAKPLLHGLALTMFVLRQTWDAVMRVLFIRPFARIPGDNFPGLVTRVAGYGIASEILDVRSRSEVSSIYRAYLERFVLDEYEPIFRNVLYQPREILEQMMTAPYYVILDAHYYKLKSQIDEHIRDLERNFREPFNLYHEVLDKHLARVSMGHIRLSESDLSGFLQDAETVTRELIVENLFRYMTDRQIAAFWLQQYVVPEAWPDLLARLLERAFSPDIFTPIEDCDDSIRVRDNHQTMMQSLLLSKEPSVKVAFEVVGHSSTNDTEERLFQDNPFWSQLNHTLYLPIDHRQEWQDLERLRARFARQA